MNHREPTSLEDGRPASLDLETGRESGDAAKKEEESKRREDMSKTVEYAGDGFLEIQEKQEGESEDRSERLKEAYMETLFIDERQDAILQWLAEHGRITTAEIQRHYGVSFDTARRDLRLLEERGKLRRTRGGALPIQQVGFRKGAGVTCRDLPEIRANVLAIAKRAVSLIRPGDVAFLTSASVGYLMTRNLPEDLSFTAVTNSILIAEELRRAPLVRVILAGGEMDEKGNCYDALSRETIRRLRFDKCFLTSACISVPFGLSIQKTGAIDYWNTILDSSKEKIGLYPTEKLGQESIVSICPASRLDTMVVDWDAAEDDLERYARLGIRVIVAEREE